MKNMKNNKQKWLSLAQELDVIVKEKDFSLWDKNEAEISEALFVLTQAGFWLRRVHKLLGGKEKYEQ